MNGCFRLDRRRFLAGSAAGFVGLAFGAGPTLARIGLGEGRLAEINLWVSIASDGTVTVQHPAAELGQGSRTVMPMIVAEEMDADWSMVRAVTAPYDSAYANPGFISNGAARLVTADSATTPGYWQTLRLAGAQARRILIESAARHWGVAAETLRTDTGRVIGDAPGRSLGYGEIVAFARVPGRMPKIGPDDFKPASAYRIIGSNVGRFDMEEKVTGAAAFGIDASLPGMLHGSVEYPPVAGSEPLEIDPSRALAVAGVRNVIALSGGVGVVADTVQAALRGRAELKVTWSVPEKTAVMTARRQRPRSRRWPPTAPLPPSSTAAGATRMQPSRQRRES